MGLVFKNNAKTTLSSGVNNSTTTIPVTEGSVFPVADATAGTFFFATLDDDTNNEIVKVTASSGSAGNQNLTVVRAQEGTTARAFSSGDKVELRLTAGMVDTFNLSGNDITLTSDKMGFGDETPEVSLDLGAKTDSLHVPVGTTAQRPASPEAGYLRYNSTTGKFEGYTNAWGDLADGSDFLVTNTFTTANNTTTTFTISNAVQDEKQLLVFIDGVFQAHNSYSVSGTTVTLSTAPASGREVTIYSALSNLQGANMVIATMTGDNSDTTLDLGVTPISENNVQVYFDGVYQHKSTFSISGQILTFSTAPPTGVAVEAITHTVLDISAAASSVLIDEFTGNGSTTAFTLSAAPTNENNTQVYVGGVYQEKATYSVSGTTLTLTEAPANGVSIEVMSIAVGQINSAIQLSDADGDTKVQVEESSDEDKIKFDTAGSERMIITNAGSVGVGTATPDRLFHVSGSATSTVAKFSNTGNVVYVELNAAGQAGADAGYIKYNHVKEMSFWTSDTERLIIDSAGHVTKPFQPAVLVTKSTSQLNIAVGSNMTHTWDSEIFDVNGDFASNTFTAPVTGKYLVNLQIRWQNIPTDILYLQTYLVTSNGFRYMGLFGSGSDLFNSSADYYRDGQSLIIDMDANDTFYVRSHQSGGTQATDIGQESYLSVALLS